MHCYYCGVSSVSVKLTRDHFIARSKGGSNKRSNLVPACMVCNATKRARTFDNARPLLIQKMLGWPKFTSAQIEWMRNRGVDLSEYDGAKLWFERQLNGGTIIDRKALTTRAQQAKPFFSRRQYVAEFRAKWKAKHKPAQSKLDL